MTRRADRWIRPTPRLRICSGNPRLLSVRAGTGRSAIRLLLEFCGVSVAHNRHLGRGAVDLGKFAAGELDGCSAKVLLQSAHLRGPRDRHDSRCLGQEPGKRKLRWGCALSLTDRPQTVDKSLVRPPRLNREARQLVAIVCAVEGGVLVDGPSEETAPQRAVWHEPYAQLRTDREYLVLRLSPPQRVLALDRGNSLDGMRTAERRCPSSLTTR